MKPETRIDNNRQLTFWRGERKSFFLCNLIFMLECNWHWLCAKMSINLKKFRYVRLRTNYLNRLLIYQNDFLVRMEFANLKHVMHTKKGIIELTLTNRKIQVQCEYDLVLYSCRTSAPCLPRVKRTNIVKR